MLAARRAGRVPGLAVCWLHGSCALEQTKLSQHRNPRAVRSRRARQHKVAAPSPNTGPAPLLVRCSAVLGRPNGPDIFPRPRRSPWHGERVDIYGPPQGARQSCARGAAHVPRRSKVRWRGGHSGSQQPRAHSAQRPLDTRRGVCGARWALAWESSWTCGRAGFESRVQRRGGAGPASGAATHRRCCSCRASRIIKATCPLLFFPLFARFFGNTFICKLVFLAS